MTPIFRYNMLSIETQHSSFINAFLCGRNNWLERL